MSDTEITKPPQVGGSALNDVLYSMADNNCCECGNPEIFALGECKQCWVEKEQLEAEEWLELHQHAVDNFYAE